MTTDLSPDTLRSRYRVTSQAAVFVTIQRLDDKRPSASGMLLEISSTSARISSNVPFQFGEKLVLCLAPESMGFSISIGCDVQWIRNLNDDEWVVQCLFGSRLELSLLETYVEKGLLERREAERHEVSLEASILFEGSTDRLEVTLYDVGNGGFCFVSPTGAEIGSRIRMFVAQGEGQEIEARTMWQSEENGEFRIGCEWTNHKGVVFAKQFSREIEPEQVYDEKRSTGTALLCAVAIAVIAFCLGTFLSSGTFSLSSLLQRISA